MTDTTDPFVPPAAEGLPLAALDSATDGASALDASARTPYGRNLLAHALVRLARDGWLRSAPAAVPSAPAARAALLREAVERLRQVPFTNVLTELRRMADEAEYVATPCSFGACEPGGEPCTTHERLMAHAEGDHELCEPDCGTSPSRMAGEAQQPETQADTALRIRVLSEILGRLTGSQDGDSATDDVPAATVRKVLAEILTGMQPGSDRGRDAEQSAAASQPVEARQADTAGEQPAT